jgi:hypothetical protein
MIRPGSDDLPMGTGEDGAAGHPLVLPERAPLQRDSSFVKRLARRSYLVKRISFRSSDASRFTGLGCAQSRAPAPLLLPFWGHIRGQA